MDETERETLPDDFTLEITDLDQPVRPTRLRRAFLTARQRQWSLIATATLFVLVVGLLLGSISDGSSPLGYLIGAPDPSSPAHAVSVYLQGNPSWGHFTLDGQTLATVPARGRERPLKLATGQHTILWQAEPFRPEKCVFTIENQEKASSPCLLNNKVTARFSEGEAAIILGFFASLDDLPAGQRSDLDQLLQATFASEQRSEQVQSGEYYAISEQQALINHSACLPFESISLCYARSDQPLIATLRVQRDSQTSLDDPCIVNGSCLVSQQDCRALCADPATSYEGGLEGWNVDAVINLLWSYRTLNGQLVASDQPNSAIGSMPNDQLAYLHIERSARGEWSIQAAQASGSDMNPICNQATTDTMTLLEVLFDDSPTMYVNQIAFEPGRATHGCLIVAVQTQPQDPLKPTPETTASTIPPAFFLLRFGVLLTVNASAQKLCPHLPKADRSATSLAQQLLTTL